MTIKVNKTKDLNKHAQKINDLDYGFYTGHFTDPDDLFLVVYNGYRKKLVFVKEPSHTWIEDAPCYLEKFDLGDITITLP